MTWRGLKEEDLCFCFSCTCLSGIRSGQYATRGDSGESTIVDYCPELHVSASVHVMFKECKISVERGHKDVAFCCEYVVMTYVCWCELFFLFWFVVVLRALRSCMFVCRPWPMMRTCEDVSSDLI